MLYCIREKFKASILFHNPPFKGMRAVGHFTALKLGINCCNEPLSYFSIKTVKIGCLFAYVKRDVEKWEGFM